MSTFQQRLTVVPGARFLEGLKRAWEAIAQAADRIHEHRRLAADRREFARLDDRVLRDLGVSRGQFELFRREALRRQIPADCARALVRGRGDNS